MIVYSSCCDAGQQCLAGEKGDDGLISWGIVNGDLINLFHFAYCPWCGKYLMDGRKVKWHIMDDGEDLMLMNPAGIMVAVVFEKEEANKLVKVLNGESDELGINFYDQARRK